MSISKENIILLLLTIVFLLPGLGGVHLFDWDEINFAEISREMIISGNYSQIQIGFQPFWEKPPLFFWLQSTCMRLFGINEFSARLPNALLGIVVIQYLFFLGKKYVNDRFGWWWALAMLGSILPYLYFRSGIIDPLFNTLIFAGAVHLFYTSFGKHKKVNYRSGIIAGFFFGAAVLTKGPVVIAIMGLVWLLGFLFIPRKNWIPIPTILMTLLFGLLTMSTWFVYEYTTNGSWFIEQFIEYQIRLFKTQDAGHGGFPGYHFVVVLLGCFPMSWFALQSIFKPQPNVQSKIQLDVLRKWMIILLAVVLVLFSIVQSKIVHYSSLAYFPLSFLAASALYQCELGKKLSKGLSIGLLANALILTIASLSLPFVMSNLDSIINDPDNIVLMATISTPVDWPIWTYIPGILCVVALLFVLIFTKQNTALRLNAIFGATILYLFIALFFFIGRIEQVSQRAAIDFYKKHAEEGYVLSHGHKSYAPYYYGKVKETPPEGVGRFTWLYSQKRDKPVYMVSKVNRVNRIKETAGFKKIGESGAFVFFVKE